MRAVSIFCQDIREEMGGTVSLTGIYPDNLQYELVQPPTAIDSRAVGVPMLPRLVVYTRVNLGADEPRGELVVRLRKPDGSDLVTNVVDEATLEKGYRESQRDNNPIVTIIARIEAAPFPVEAGRLLVLASYNGEEQIAGTLNFVEKN